MRLRILAVAALLAPFGGIAAAAESPIVIHELYAAPDSAVAGDREFIELFNPGTSSVDLAGWRIMDATGNTFTFSGQTIPAGGYIVVWGGGQADGRGPAWSRSTAWNNAGDEATLRDAAGAVIDTFAYGGHDNATVAAAPAGVALHRGTPWIEAPPTPGYHDEPQGGEVAGTVPNVPPAIDDVVAPASVGRSAPLTITFDLRDDNGDALAWNLTDGGAMLANGTSPGGEVALFSPAQPGLWAPVLSVTDGVDTTTQALAITVRPNDLQVTFPAGDLHFDELLPGAVNVTTGTFRIDNIGTTPLAPRIDVSDLAGPTIVPVEGRLQVGWDDGSGIVWIDYDGPLTALPQLPADSGAEVHLRLRDVPLPLPAGAYGTTFTVVA